MTEMADAVLSEVRRIMAQELDVTRPVALDDELAAFPELDSIGLITLAVGLEDRFRVKLTGADAGPLVTVRDLARLIARRRAQDGS